MAGERLLGPNAGFHHAPCILVDVCATPVIPIRVQLYDWHGLRQEYPRSRVTVW